MKTHLALLALLGATLVTGQDWVPLDLAKSGYRIKDQVQVTREKPAQWHLLPGIIEDALECITSMIPVFTVKDAKWMPPALTHYIESVTLASIAKDLKNVDWSELEGANITQDGEGFEESLKEFMQTQKFVNIHNHIWSNAEAHDLMKFVHSAGYPGAYQRFITFYEKMNRTDLCLPTGPDDLECLTSLKSAKVNSEIPNNAGNRLPEITMSLPTIKAECQLLPEPNLDPLWEVLQRLNDSNIHEVIKVILYIMQEVVGNVAMHVFLLKIGEGQKGELVHTLLNHPDMDEGMQYVQGIILYLPEFAQLNRVIKTFTGLDMWNLNLFKYVMNLIMYLIWNYPFPTS